MKNICIAGHSWACGEWDYIKNLYRVSHNGLTEYLSVNNKVKNCGIPGGSLEETKIILQRKLLYSKFDYIFLFQTDPLRNLRPYQFLKTDPNITFEKIVKLTYQELESSYQQLNSLGVKIHLIGGCSRVDTILVKKFDNLIPYISSFTEFLLPGYKHPELWFSDWLSLIGKQFSIECLDKFWKCKKVQDSLLQEKHYFYPDGLHPNRAAHKILFDKICEDFQLQ